MGLPHQRCTIPQPGPSGRVTITSKWLKTKDARLSDFHWQTGYGAFSVSQSEADKVVAYIRDQQRHHQKLTFQDEYRRFLELHRVESDERYVWD